MNPATYLRLGERYICLQHKPCQQHNRKLDAQCGDMRAYSDETKLQHILLKHKIVYEVIKDPVKHKIDYSRNSVSEELDSHVFAKRRVKEIDKSSDQIKYFLHYNGKPGVKSI